MKRQISTPNLNMPKSKWMMRVMLRSPLSFYTSYLKRKDVLRFSLHLVNRKMVLKYYCKIYNAWWWLDKFVFRVHNPGSLRPNYWKWNYRFLFQYKFVTPLTSMIVTKPDASENTLSDAAQSDYEGKYHYKIQLHCSFIDFYKILINLH